MKAIRLPRWTFTMLGVMSITALCYSQAPVLTVSVTSQGVGKGYQVFAANHYSSPATELIVQVTYWRASTVPCRPPNRGPDGRCHFTVRRHMIPSVGMRGEIGSTFPARWIVQPAQTILITGVGAQAIGIESATNVAVIYDDGATAGDIGVLRQMMAQRRHDLTDAQDALALLREAAGNPATDIAGLAVTFSARAKLHRAEMDATRDSGVAHLDRYGPSGDPICSAVAVNLKRVRNTATADERAAALAGVIQLVNGHIALLQASPHS